jgi:RimJ/RimL family protein N-acetyltransferase
MPNHSTYSGPTPVIETARLRMRAHRVEDLADCAAMWADPEVVRYIGGRPYSREEVWARLLRYAGHWALLNFGYWAIEEKTSGAFAGELGFADFEREMESPLRGLPELGYAFASRTHGKGYATEAARAAVAWGDAHFVSARTACIIHPDNLASIRVAEKCGYREFERATYKGEPAIVLAR